MGRELGMSRLSVNTENEQAVVRALTADPVPRTRIIVAHRAAGVRAADRILFREDGRITEDGTFDQLIAAGGRFAEFWDHQEAATGRRLRR
ncbi:ABC transporter ATP-binding protein [Actinoplanes couchii]|uniref:ABC transporter ATP-binding protein n=1 Tax=Actinoplanes couchii TaxID=403638 RepID=UPI0019436C8C|nr:ABC transporter ATP-binding protein [Actinoplanes couchii]MDR6317419.1 ABC-type multidrug transport system fused ATPase/permease subunit [Actinoplanes couchii]